jgi:hypothetical protein
MENKPKLLTLKEVSQRVGGQICARTVQRLADKGLIEHRRVGLGRKKRYMIPSTQVAKLRRAYCQ